MSEYQKNFEVNGNNLVNFAALSMYSWFIIVKGNNEQELYIKTSNNSAVRLSSITLVREFGGNEVCMLINPTTITVDC